jgi:hypothetical protein
MAQFSRRLPATLLLCTALSAVPARAQARFDLAGPKVDIRVTRAGVSLPIAEVPNLQPGDQIWLHPDLPPSQSVHYLLVAAFLRGTTNPPPDDWFVRIETWQKHVREEGVIVTVPPEAQQAILFLAPETGGDFSTLRSAVKGRPGIFVRADQDLIEAGFEQARIEKYLAEMKKVDPGDPAALTMHSNLLARTLNLKPNPDCFKRPVDLQYNCLTQTGAQTLLDDGHGQSVVTALSNGPGSDFINQASYTQLAGAGSYSAYVGAIVDLVRLTSTLHTAQYQYIPAIAFPNDASLNLRLNTPPSFHNPKSVIVIGLPAVQKAVLPPLRPAEPNHVSCLLNPRMVLPIDGAPLVFSTVFAHQLVLHLNLPAGTTLPGEPVEIPVTPDAFQGGLTIAPPEPARHELPIPPDTALADPSLGVVGFPSPKPPVAKPVSAGLKKLPEPAQPITGTVKGMWGFNPFTGPTLAIQALPGGGWHIFKTASTPENLIAGQPNHLEIASTGTACIQGIDLEPGGEKVDWKLDEKAEVPEKPGDQSSKEAAKQAAPSSPPPAAKIHPVDLTLNLQHAEKPGSIQLAIQQFGQKTPDQLGTKTFAEPARIESLAYHAGDSSVTLAGSGLDEVKQLTLKSAVFAPAPPNPDAPGATAAKSLTLVLASDAHIPEVKPDDKLQADVLLNDGRTLDASTIAQAPRPAVTILSRRMVSAASSPIELSSPNEVPLGAQLLFFLKSKQNFPRTEQIEIANQDDSLATRLTLKDGALVLQDSHTVLATFDPLKTFGASAFGPFRLRAIAGDGTEGEWQPLATIVRLPTLTQLSCGTVPTDSCLLTGNSLYLIESVATTLPFTDATKVPEGFVDTTLAIPHPAGQTFYLRLRDDPSAIQQVTLAITPAPPATAKPTTARAVPPTAK